jgi:hypothetical protein
MNDSKRNKIITFRVTDEEYTKIQDAALTRGTDPNNWCRDAALSCSVYKLTINEHVFYVELGLLRFLLTNGFNLLIGDDSETAAVWSECMDRADQRADELFTNLMSRRKRA